MATEPIQALPYPVPGDAPDGPNQIKALADAVVVLVNQRYASTAARDAARPTPTEGEECVTGTGLTMVKWLYFNGDWRDVTVRPGASFAPTLYSNNVAVAGATASGRYVQIGKLVTYWFIVTLGATAPSPAGTFSVDLPVTAAATGNTSGSLRLFDSSAGVARLDARIAVSATTRTAFQYTTTFGGTLGNVGYNAPWTWGSGDILDGFLVYEAA